MFRDWLRANSLYVCGIIIGGICIPLGVAISWRELSHSGAYLIGWMLGATALDSFKESKRKRQEAKK